MTATTLFYAMGYLAALIVLAIMLALAVLGGIATED